MPRVKLETFGFLSEAAPEATEAPAAPAAASLAGKADTPPSAKKIVSSPLPPVEWPPERIPVEAIPDFLYVAYNTANVHKNYAWARTIYRLAATLEWALLAEAGVYKPETE
jgi:hypothetical protein